MRADDGVVQPGIDERTLDDAMGAKVPGFGVDACQVGGTLDDVANPCLLGGGDE